VTYQPLDVLTMLGFVILIGVVVNNAILVVHQTLNFMDSGKPTDAGSSEAEPARGLAVREAIRESVRSRVRPIMMSMLTTTFGLLPLVMSSGAGSELYRGIGSVVLGGLIVSTMFTLLVVPSLFSLLMDLKPRRQQQRVPRKVVATGMSEA
jgi:HAE1 family hydrophobic/amphiphilic exporter-1